MKRNLTHNKLEEQAMDDLRDISDTPWHQQKTHQLFIKSVNLKRVPNQHKDQIRPSTQQNTKRMPFFNQSPLHRVTKTTYQMPMDVKYIREVPKSQEFKISPIRTSLVGKNRIRTRSEIRDMKIHKTQDYSQLRKTYETGFYIGNKMPQRSQKSEKKSQNMIKSSRKGRLWLGRPVLLFSPLYQQN